MSILNLKPPVYVIWVREDRSWGQEDLMYGLVHKGNTRFGHNDFKIVCNGKEGKCFFTNKVKDEEAVTWDDCLEALQEKDQPVGSPLLLTDRVHTFAELAHLGYKQGIFTSDAGLKYLATRTKPPSTAILAKQGENLSRKDMLGRSKADSDEIDKLKAGGVPVENPSLAQLAGLPFAASGFVALNESMDSSASSVEEISPGEVEVQVPATSMEEVTQDILQLEVENFKKKASEAMARYDHLEVEVEQLRNENAELKAKLAASTEVQKELMVVSDKALVCNESMNDDTATVVTKKVLSALGKRLGSLDAVELEVAKIGGIATEVAKLDDVVSDMAKIDGLASDLATIGPSVVSVQNDVKSLSDEMSNMGEFMTKMSEFMGKLSPFMKSLPGTVAAKVGEDFDKKTLEFKKGFESVTSRIDTSHDALEEGIAVTNSVLENFGMGEGENGVDIPSLLRQMYEDTRMSGHAENELDVVEPTENMETVGMDMGDFVFGAKECFFVSKGKAATFVCKCGCGACVCVAPPVTTQASTGLSVTQPGGGKEAASASGQFTPQNQSEGNQLNRLTKRKLKQKNYHENKKAKRLNFNQETPKIAAEVATVGRGFSIPRFVKAVVSHPTSAPHLPVWEGGFKPRK